MSVHVEWLDAANTGVELVKQGDVVPEDGDTEVEGEFGIALGGDDIVVIQGSAGELQALAGRICAALGMQINPGPEIVVVPQFCDYCDLEIAWDAEVGWVDIADGLPTYCESSPDGKHGKRT